MSAIRKPRRYKKLVTRCRRSVKEERTMELAMRMKRMMKRISLL